jgi:NDP-sugar pyrophosphorylase family protein
VTDVSFTQGRCLEALDVFVLAGGLGTRARPVLGDLPKILAPILGRPYLAFLLDWLERFGARRVILGLGHRAEAVIGHLNAQPQKRIDVATVVEPAPLGTAGAIRFARGALRSDPVLVMNGDSFTDADLCAFVDCHGAANARGSVLCAEVEDAGRYGRIEVDGCGRVGRFIEKDTEFHGRALINAGVYLLSAALLDDIAASCDAVSLERDVFERLPPGSLAAHAGRFRFIDVGTPESLALAAGLFAARPHGQNQK